MKRKDAIFVIGIMVLFIIGATIHATQGVMLSSYINEYSLQAGAQGYPAGIQEVGLIFSIFLSAFLLRKFSKPTILLFMATIMTFTLVGLGLRPSFWLLCTFYLSFGLSFGSLDSLASSLISDLYPDKSRIMLSYMRAFYSAGGMFAPLILNYLLQRGHIWHRAIMQVAGFCLILLFYFVFIAYPRIPKPVNHTEIKDDVSLPALLSYIKKPKAYIIILIGFFFAFHQIGLTVWIVRYLSVYNNIGSVAGFVLSAYWIGMLVSRTFLPRLISSPKIVLIWGTLIASVLLCVELLVNHGGLACILMALVGLSEGLIVPMIVDCACEIDRSNSVMACSTLIFINNIGGMIAPPIIGLLVAKFSPTIGISLLPLSLVVCCILSIILFYKDWRVVCQELPKSA